MAKRLPKDEASTEPFVANTESESFPGITTTIEPKLFITKGKTIPPKTLAELDSICNKDENKPNQNKYYKFIGETLTPHVQEFSPGYSGENELIIKLPDGSLGAIQRYGYSAGSGILRLPLHYRNTFVDINNLANERNFNVYSELVILDGDGPAVRGGGGDPKFNTAIVQESPILCGFVPRLPAIKVLSPNGGETYEIGKTYKLKWSGGANVNNLSTIEFQLLSEDGNTGYDTLKGGLPQETANDGIENWKVSSVEPGKYRLRILCIGQADNNIGNCDFTNNGFYDPSDSSFSIVAATSL